MITIRIRQIIGYVLGIGFSLSAGYALVPQTFTDNTHLMINSLGLSVPQVGKFIPRGEEIKPEDPNTWARPALLIAKDLVIIGETVSQYYNLRGGLVLEWGWVEFRGQKYKFKIGNNGINAIAPNAYTNTIAGLDTSAYFYVAKLERPVEGIVPFKLATRRIDMNIKALIATCGSQLLNNEVKPSEQQARVGVGITAITHLGEQYIFTKFCEGNQYSAALPPLKYVNAASALFLLDTKSDFVPILYGLGFCSGSEPAGGNEGTSIFVDVTHIDLQGVINEINLL